MPQMEIVRLVNDVEAHQVVIHARGSATSPVGPYKAEYVYFLTLDEAGKQITRIDEFVDSAFAMDFLGKLEALKKQREGQ